MNFVGIWVCLDVVCLDLCVSLLLLLIPDNVVGFWRLRISGFAWVCLFEVCLVCFACLC